MGLDLNLWMALRIGWMRYLFRRDVELDVDDVNVDMDVDLLTLTL